MDEEGVIPQVDQMLNGQRLDLGKIHDHPVGAIAVLTDDLAAERDFDGIAMAMQMAALALVVRNTMTGIKLKAARDQH
jgi:hypothetical protein